MFTAAQRGRQPLQCVGKIGTWCHSFCCKVAQNLSEMGVRLKFQRALNLLTIGQISKNVEMRTVTIPRIVLQVSSQPN